MTSTEIKGEMITKVKNYKEEHYPVRYINEGFIGITPLVLRDAFLGLEAENIFKFDKTRAFISLTKTGIRAAEIGYSIFENEVEEVKKQEEIDAKTKAKLELKALQFNDRWKWTIIVGFIIAVVSFILSLIPYLKK
jgi:hypothetical protein